MTPYPYELEDLARRYGVPPLHALEWFLERAAIREYDGGFDRAEAERLAMEDVRQEFTSSRRSDLNAAPLSSRTPTGSQRMGEPNASGKRGTMPRGGQL